jgi:hypothetical protein
LEAALEPSTSDPLNGNVRKPMKSQPKRLSASHVA